MPSDHISRVSVPLPIGSRKRNRTKCHGVGLGAGGTQSARTGTFAPWRVRAGGASLGDMVWLRRRISTAVVARAVGAAVVAVGCAYLLTYRYWRRWCLGWGSTSEELNRLLPGDDVLDDPDVVSTRSVSIEAPPTSVWPWLVQMGPGRGGAYTYDWIENLFGLGMHSADKILPQYQHLDVGDAYQLGAHGPVLRVASLDPEHSLVLRSDDGNWVWALVLRPEGAITRLTSRNRIASPGASALTRAVTTYIMEPGSLIMERKMLLGIKDRAEHLAAEGRDEGSLHPSQPQERNAGEEVNEQTPVPRPKAAWAILACVVSTARLLCTRRLHLDKEHVGERIHFADGTAARVFRETTADCRPSAPCALVVVFRLRWVRGWGHPMFRCESLLNTPLFAGFPGFVSKLWLAADERDRYRGVYEWDEPLQAEYYARCLWRILELVSVRGSIGYRVIPGVTRTQALHNGPSPLLADTHGQLEWWRPVGVSDQTGSPGSEWPKPAGTSGR